MGRLIGEDLRIAAETPLLAMKQVLADVPESARERTAAALATLFGPQNAISSTTYTYDSNGRLVERRMRMGTLGGHCTVFRYDQRGNPVEESVENTSRAMRIDDQGNLHQEKETSHIQHMRFEYGYDAPGNWTERVVWSRLGPDPAFARSNATRREIGYYGAS